MFSLFNRRLARVSMALALSSAPAMAEGIRLPPDTPTTVAGIESVCTGVGLDARQDPRWPSYSLKVEFAGPGGQYLGDEHLVLRRSGKELLSLICDGPWVLFRLPPGRYEVEAQVGQQTTTSAAFAPASGQGRIILRFANGDVP